MEDIRNNFSGGLNLDDSFNLLPKTCYGDALNITRDALEGNNDRILTNIIGNRLVPYTFQPGGVPKCIGAEAFQLRNAVYSFIWHPTGYHVVHEFNSVTRTITKIFENLTDSGGIDILGFTENGKIKSIDIYPRENEGDLLFFLDSLGRPTEMDIARFKAGEYIPVTRAIIDKAKKPPLLPPSVVFDNDTATRSNDFRNKLTRYKYRWIYDDFETSVFSPISVIPYPVSILSDIYTNVITNNNVVRISLNSGDKNAKSVEIGFSYVNKTNDWSDFQTIAVIDKNTLAFSSSVQIVVNDFGTEAIVSFKGSVAISTIINIYLTLLPSTQVLIATYTTVLGDTPTSVASALVASLISFGISTNQGSTGSLLYIFYNDSTYSFSQVSINAPSLNVDNIDFLYSFYNDSTYPNIKITESIQLYDYVPPFALAQGMPDGNVLAYGGISEGYNKDTTENAIITVGTVAAGNGGAVGNLSSTTIRRTDVLVNAVMDATFSGIPATGTVINLKLRRRSDGVIITGGTYTTIATDTIYTIVASINYSAADATVHARTGATFKSYISMPTYETFSGTNDYLQIEIIPPTTATATNSIATWPWSSSGNVARGYFDEKGVTNGVLYTDKVVFPAYAENGSGQPLIPFINYKINDIPPSWAYSVAFYFTKDPTFYKVWESLAVQKETAYIYFEVTSFITNATKKPTTTQVCSYSFQDGDRLRIWRDTNGVVFDDTYDSAIEGLVDTPTINGVVQPTGSLFIKIKNIEPFTTSVVITTNYVLFIYRPAQQEGNLENLVYYEFGSSWPILDPTLSTRRHSGQVTDQVVGVTPAEFNFYQGDAYFRARTIASTDTGYATFNVIDQNFVDFFISAVNNIDGRPNEIDINARNQFFGATIRFGEAYQANTNINGLNRFYENNLMDVDYSHGNIVAFVVREKFLKTFQQFKIGIIPLYGELTKDGSGNVSLIVTDKLLNPIQYHIGNLGLSTATSLASWHFADYGVDIPKGIIWRDSDDGVEPISELNKVDSWATVEIPLRTGNSNIYGAIDPKKNQYISALEAYTVPVPYFNIIANGLNSIIGTTFVITSSDTYTIDWGDGTVDSFVAGTSNPTHVYTTPYTGNIRVYPVALTDITVITFNSSGISPATSSMSILTSEVNKLSNISVLGTSDAVYLNGIVTDLPTGLTLFGSSNTNLSGDVADLSRSLIRLSISGTNTLSGNTSDLPTGLVYLLLYGNNTLTGDVVNLPRGITLLYVNGSNTLSGNILFLPVGLIQVQILGNNVVTGNISGFTTTLSSIIIYGFNTLLGNISGLPTGLVTITILGNNTITGALSGMPSAITFFQITGNNTISGDLAHIANGIQFINVNSSYSTIDTYTNGVRTWSSTMNAVLIVPSAGGFSTTEVDNILIELAAQATTWVGTKTISLLGGSSPRSASSDAAVVTLNGRGVIVNTI